MRIVYVYPSLAVYGGIERILIDKMNYLAHVVWAGCIYDYI